MGTTWSGWLCPSNENEIDHPKLFGDPPEAQSMSEVAPTLMLYDKPGQKDFSWKFSFKQDANQMKAEIDEARHKGLFNFELFSQNRLVIITHGFRSSGQEQWVIDMKDAILKYSDSQTGFFQQRQVVAILDWHQGASTALFHYPQAASNSLAVGGWLAEWIYQFKQSFPKVQVYGIGHSLGAHLLGMAGRKSHGSFDRITGLDPAGVGFQNEGLQRLQRLHPDDALLVDAIHTDGQNVPYFGTLVPCGKIDFYPNYGYDQPSDDGTNDAKPKAKRDRNNRKTPINHHYGNFITESHVRCIEYFIWSIWNGGKFRTHQKLESEPDVETPVHRIITTPMETDVQVEMGYHLDTFIQQTFYKSCDKMLQPRSEPEEHPKESPKESNHHHHHHHHHDGSEIYKKYYGCYYVHTNGQVPWS